MIQIKIDEPMKDVARLFQGWHETSIWSCLQGHMGYAMTDEQNPPASAQIVLGDFCFFAGKPNEQLAEKAGASIIIPRTEEWFPVIEQVWGDKAYRGTRYSIKKEPDVFDREKLSQYARSLPGQYELKLIDKAIYGQIMAETWSSDLCAQFSGAEDYEKRGIGVAVLREGIPVAGASSYSIYTEGIEIEIDTREDCRRKGLATACGAKLILECLDRGLYPSWDAHDLRSVALAEKLGYHKNQAYTVYFLKNR